LAPWVVANIDNNMKALLLAGLAGLIVAFIIALFVKGGPVGVVKTVEPGTNLGLAFAVVLIGLAWWAFRSWDDFEVHAHSYSAIAMFGFLGFAIASNAVQRRHDPPKIYCGLYSAIAATMFVSGAIMLAFKSKVEHMVFILEATEITLFAAFWLVQTRELWYEAVRDPDGQVDETLPTVAT
ncbi:MAG: uncharacterized protein JWN99_1981, partial [Ilumatobacteraceae bacterium]|nr:uncharacterized protein [Ilumatobacteraceae bacterium]